MKSKLLIAVLLLAACQPAKEENKPESTVAKATSPPAAPGFGQISSAVPADTITVYKSPTCGCCRKWIEHLESNGFAVKAIDRDDMASIKTEQGVAPALQSCHTGTIAGYTIEGHVPASDIRRLLAERPKIAGLAVPGMPMGSPGMEGPTSQPFQVTSFTKKGATATFAQH